MRTAQPAIATVEPSKANIRSDPRYRLIGLVVSPSSLRVPAWAVIKLWRFIVRSAIRDRPDVAADCLSQEESAPVLKSGGFGICASLRQQECFLLWLQQFCSLGPCALLS